MTVWGWCPWSSPPSLVVGRAAGFDSVLPSGPDIAQFKQGVKSVAGKMAVLANGVMNTIQVKAAADAPARQLSRHASLTT